MIAYLEKLWAPVSKNKSVLMSGHGMPRSYLTLFVLSSSLIFMTVELQLLQSLLKAEIQYFVYGRQKRCESISYFVWKMGSFLSFHCSKKEGVHSVAVSGPQSQCPYNAGCPTRTKDSLQQLPSFLSSWMCASKLKRRGHIH